MNTQKVIANLIADGWTLEAATLGAKLIDSALPLPSLFQLTCKVVRANIPEWRKVA
jgi:hypothetical protein